MAKTQRLHVAHRSAGPSGQPRWKTILKWTAVLGLVGMACAVSVLAAVFWWYGRAGLPTIEKLGDYHPKQVSIIVDKNQHRIGELFEDNGRRTFIPYNKIPKLVVDSFVAAEDQKFWTHGGIDYVGMVRALITNLKSNKTKQGASTITQQVVKTFVLSPEKTFKRKIQEVILARRLEHNLSKEEIITLYLNQIYLGHGRYGIQEAARYYFGKDVEQVNAGEAAVLAALPKSPNEISPRTHPDRAKERQIYVLKNMVVTEKLTQAEAQKWIDAPIQLVKEPYPALGSAPEWIELARADLVAQKGEAAMATLGATIQTTVDPEVQKAAQRALQKALRGVDNRLHIARPRRRIAEDKIAGELAKLQKRTKGAPKPGEPTAAIVIAVQDTPAQLQVDLGGWQATLSLGGRDDARLNPAKEDGHIATPSERFARGDEITVVPIAATASKSSDRADAADAEPDATPSKTIAAVGNHAMFAPGPQGAVVVMEIKTRKVRALVGGYATTKGSFNRATMAKRQPGSSFKPIVYAAAMHAGLVTPARIVNDAPEVYDLWKPQNYKKGAFEGPVRLRYALAKSINTVAIRVCHEVGPDNVRAMASKLGIAGELPHEMSIALGSGEVTPLDMANAFATLAGGGWYAPPRFIEAVNGVAAPVPAPTAALRPEVAYVITDMMRSVVEEGTGHAAKSLGLVVAGKTGTSNDARDVWFVGTTPDYVIAVWIGNDNNDSLGSETGGSTAVPVFVDIAKAMGLQKKSFDRPAGVVEVKIDKVTGLLAAPGAPAST
ncbi:MAG: PBP1A family penicillin-binding protein, partial [Kofleriaceae bacterium]|nr:PBP1A family penicillin-binding protein [Kofleriaceae bacterium]